MLSIKLVSVDKEWAIMVGGTYLETPIGIINTREKMVEMLAKFGCAVTENNDVVLADEDTLRDAMPRPSSPPPCRPEMAGHGSVSYYG